MSLYDKNELKSGNSVGGEPIFASPEQAAQIQPTLPSPGVARDELLARRTDALAEAAETGPERQALPSNAFDIDREIRADIENDYMNIGADHPYLKFCWVNFVNVNGSEVWKKKRLGWIVVDRALARSENIAVDDSMFKADNTIRVGDVLLMSIRMDRYLQIVQREDDARRRQQFGLESDVRSIAEKYPNVFKNVSTDGNPTLDPRTQDIVNRRRGAGKVALNAIGEQMKQPGGVPGIPMPGQSRGRR